MKYKIVLLVLFMSTGLFAQEVDTTQAKDAYVIEDINVLPHTSVKDQNRSGTCWSYSGISFLESESMRMGHDSLNLSEMFIVRHNYAFKAERYVRTHGELNFGQGGSFYDVLWAYDVYGALTDSMYDGIEYGEDAPVFGELDAVFDGYVNGVIKNRNKKLSPVWKKGFNALLDTYFGVLPLTVDVDGQALDAKGFAEKKVGVNANDYVSITSYTHHPFYSSFILEIPDNWQWSSSYNVPLADLMSIMNYSLEQGYTIAWGGDVSEKGFSHKKGLAIIPETDVKEMADSERSKWENKEKGDFYKFEEIVPEKTITQELRQEGFDNWTTTDDHGMHIVGTAQDQNGKIYYKTKNSWNTEKSKYNGFLYMSEAFVEYKTMNIIVNKEAIPKSIRKKLGL